MVYNAVKSYNLGPGLTFQKGPFASKDTPKKVKTGNNANEHENMNPISLSDYIGDAEVFVVQNETIKKPGLKTKGGETMTIRQEEESETNSLLKNVVKAATVTVGVAGVVYAGKHYYENGASSRIGRTKNLFEAASDLAHLRTTPMDYTTPHQEQAINDAGNLMDYKLNSVNLTSVVGSPRGGASKYDDMRAENEYKRFHEKNKSLLEQTIHVAESLGHGIGAIAPIVPGAETASKVIGGLADSYRLFKGLDAPKVYAGRKRVDVTELKPKKKIKSNIKI